jgi:hypothetical protein
LAVEGRMFKIPHEGSGIQKVDCSNAEARILHRAHGD